MLHFCASSPTGKLIAGRDGLHCRVSPGSPAGCQFTQTRDGLARRLFGKQERVKGIEPSYQAWEACVLPLNYTRDGSGSTRIWPRLLTGGDARCLVVAPVFESHAQLLASLAHPHSLTTTAILTAVRAVLQPFNVVAEIPASRRNQTGEIKQAKCGTTRRRKDRISVARGIDRHGK